MVQVPVYGGQQVSLRPELQQGISVQATPGAFGADIGAGMQKVGQGLGQAADAVSQLREFQDKLKAKDSLTAFEREKMQLDYGPNGYMTQQGANAAEGYSKYQQDLEALKKKHGSVLKGSAAQVFDQAATDAVTQGMRSGIVHAAQGTKDWAASSSTARLATFGDQALAAYNKPAEIQRNIAAGFSEINEQGKLMGWGSEVLDLKKREFATGVHANVALAMASKPNGAGAALTYLNQNAALIDTKTRLDMETKLKPYVDEEKATSVINDLMSRSRASASPSAAAGRAGPTAAQAGPTAARADLINRAKAAGKGADHVDGLDDHFATNLSSLFQDAPENIRAGLQVGSGYRSIQRQQELWDASDKTGKWVARPGGSKHNHGQAVDIWYNGQRLDKAPAEVREWVHANAGKYGLRFPMSYEPWHIEPNGARGGAATGSTVVPSMDTVAARSSMPSYDEAMTEINKITDPAVKAAAIKQFNAQVEMRSKAEAATQKVAKDQVWQMVAQGTPVSQIPLDLKLAAGREAISGFMEYEGKAGEINTDPILLRNLTLFGAQNPTEFAKIDLTAPEIINGLSKSDLKALTEKQATALTDERKSREEGIAITSAMTQAKTQLEAVGITSTGIATSDTDARQAMARREAMFQAELAREMQAFKDVNSGRNPNQMEIQSMINRLLLPVVMKTTTPGMMWGTNTNETESLFFEGGGRLGEVAPGSKVELNYKIENIPAADRAIITQNLALPPPAGLGRQPSEAEVVTYYQNFQATRLGLK